MKTETSLPAKCDVAIIGAGPAGLSTAIELKKLGVKDVIVLERQSVAGGTPRNCGHSIFGLREFKRAYFGARYADRLVEKATEMGVRVVLNTTVTSLADGGLLHLSTTGGTSDLQAKRIVLSTGIRELPRAPRFVSGSRPLGVTTTGALQSIVYQKNKIPFKHPVIIGSELVSFSALMTCRHAKIKPVAMIESNNRITVWSMARLLPLSLGIKLMLETEIIEIIGKQQVTGVKILNSNGSIETIDCDGVVFSGQFQPEAALLRIGNLAIDQYTGGPVVDQYGRCSDEIYFATGNLLRPVETAGWCWNEGIQTARNVVQSLQEKLPDTKQQVRLQICSPVIKYVVPQVLAKCADDRKYTFQIHLTKPAKGLLSICSNSDVLWCKKINSLPERRIILSVPSELLLLKTEMLQINFDEYSRH